MLEHRNVENLQTGLIGPTGFAISILIPVVLLGSYGGIAYYKRRKRAHLVRCLKDLASQHFLVQACTKCNESDMLLLEVSPNSRSIHYACKHCGKKSRASACSDAAQQAYDKLAAFQKLNSPLREVSFQTPVPPLPHEQTTREPIPKAMSSEVWRRDLGRCVQCGTNQALQSDHIIPVSKGGSTTVANLQILCEACNRAKAAKI